MQTKVCTSCKTEKSKSDFYASDAHCKVCRKARSAAYYEKNKDRVQARHAVYSREKAEVKRARASAWAKENRARRAEICAAYYTSKAKAFVPWANRDRIGAFYDEARRKTLETGIQHHVDHIVPLQGRNVSGLHVEWNLQVIPAIDNARKRNKFAA